MWASWHFRVHQKLGFAKRVVVGVAYWIDIGFLLVLACAGVKADSLGVVEREILLWRIFGHCMPWDQLQRMEC